MASFDFDQAEGLRRMLAGPKPRIVTFLSATPQDDKGAMLVNLGASLAQSGNDVLIVDACERDYGVAQRLGVDRSPGLLQVARQECALNQVIQTVPQGFSVVKMNGVVPASSNVVPASSNVVPAKAGTQAWIPASAGMTIDDARRLAKTFDVLVKQSAGSIVIVDGEFSDDDSFPVPIMASSEIVVQVSTSATSITNAYALVKRLSQHLGRRPFGILVTGATEAEAKVVYDNMSSAATRYLAVTLSSMGSVPADEYLQRAARLGRAVVDAFPLAGASVAFRRLAGRFAMA
ncbi:MinD/ParA family protein [Massilia norwichensis]|uniref:Antiactivator of flagellar biosynthesis FleN protein n=1 Tax=Massilia norwichensis TaxID=1442366 RepID=A0ABT2A5Q8_9BURK|nr:antiactivator of flagellar biosynthesis FleN protein [Massilia norwichensis]MCS0589435.1 antiactivator of flagellar biosynthesis FleN protein [Massilia norwichensis]